MGLKDLRGRYEELFGDLPRSKNLPFLRKQLAFRIQERMEGGLSVVARERLEEILPSALPEPRKTGAPPCPASRDTRLPAPGTVLVRPFKGFDHEVEVLVEDFRYRGRTYTSLSTLAKEITGTSWNGFAFFGLSKEKAHG